MPAHQRIEIGNERGETVEAIAPVVVSASRATDIPAFYARELFDSLERGYTIWTNPYNGKTSYVSFANTRFVVFWSKNPDPLLPYLPKLKERGVGFYIQFTLNDYEREGLEPNVPRLTDRVDAFKKFVDRYGIGHVVWRFDPLILTDEIGINELLDKIGKIGLRLRGYTEKLVFSFADISGYRKVGVNLSRAGVNYREWDEQRMIELAKGLSLLNDAELHLQLATCAEAINLEAYGVEHNRCIDPDLISRLAPDDLALQMWLFGATKDRGQRKACGCVLSKDIGRYNTCPHGCLYCYANNSPFGFNNEALKSQR